MLCNNTDPISAFRHTLDAKQTNYQVCWSVLLTSSRVSALKENFSGNWHTRARAGLVHFEGDFPWVKSIRAGLSRRKGILACVYSLQYPQHRLRPCPWTVKTTFLLLVQIYDMTTRAPTPPWTNWYATDDLFDPIYGWLPQFCACMLIYNPRTHSDTPV